MRSITELFLAVFALAARTGGQRIGSWDETMAADGSKHLSVGVGGGNHGVAEDDVGRTVMVLKNQLRVTR